jgi:hypothetical protein
MQRAFHHARFSLFARINNMHHEQSKYPFNSKQNTTRDELNVEMTENDVDTVHGQHEVMNIYGGTAGQLIEPHNNVVPKNRMRC